MESAYPKINSNTHTSTSSLPPETPGDDNGPNAREHRGWPADPSKSPESMNKDILELMNNKEI